MSILDTIVAHKLTEVAARKAELPLAVLRERLAEAPQPRDFLAALLSSARPAPRVIAEIKRRSPSKGELRPGLDAAELARIYEQNGASAISVLTDKHFFGGSLDDMRNVRAATTLPLLRKDFVIDPYQIYEARMAGADAILLIAAILAPEQIAAYSHLAAELGMAALVEVHNRAELTSALTANANLIGINNRDLHTFNVTLDTTRAFRPLIPPGVVVVSESGIYTQADRESLQDLNVDALLVGESLLVSDDIAQATRVISGISSQVSERSVA
ncbi:MAG: indole-3-glycerol phosphate synthase TrpC [Chloroflexota bacterium]